MKRSAHSHLFSPWTEERCGSAPGRPGWNESNLFASVPEARPEPPKPAPEDPVKTIGKQIATDPGQAVALLKPLVLAQPSSLELQGNYLAAIYRTRNAVEFERALTRACIEKRCRGSGKLLY